MGVLQSLSSRKLSVDHGAPHLLTKLIYLEASHRRGPSRQLFDTQLIRQATDFNNSLPIGDPSAETSMLRKFRGLFQTTLYGDSQRNHHQYFTLKTSPRDQAKQVDPVRRLHLFANPEAPHEYIAKQYFICFLDSQELTIALKLRQQLSTLR
jgi:hypothetical protein